MLIDTHSHLSSFSDVNSVIVNSQKNGVKAIISVSGNFESSKKVLKIARNYPNYVFPGIGIHPSEVLKEDLMKVLDFVDKNSNKVILIGEVGLDYSYPLAVKGSTRKKQIKVYKSLLSIAKKFGLPVSIHSRLAYSDAFNLLIENGPKNAVFHWYDGPLDILNRILDEGFFISATPAIEYSKNHRLVIENTPLERILVETDCPFYLRSLRRRNEPSDVILVLKELAKIKEQDLNEVIKISGMNSVKLFKKMAINTNRFSCSPIMFS
jgi:TatD DNase family protein